MVDQIKHRNTLVDILKSVYGDPDLRTILGFKGGTAAMLFYDLPRLSVDLDFDLLDAEKKDLVFEKMKTLLEQHGVLREAREKHFTLLFIISYEKGEHTVKVDISKRKGSSSFEPKSYLGITALVMKKEDMVAGKLAALLTRRRFAMRDVFDVCFFLRNKWSINEEFLTEKTELSLRKALEQAIKQVSEIKDNQALRGLGELLDAKQKAWVKAKMRDDTIFYLRMYQENKEVVAPPPSQELASEIPVLDIDPSIGGTGGPQGHFVHFFAINTGEKVAIDVNWGIRGFAYEWRSPDTFVLRPGDRQKLEYKISGEKPFNEFVPELNIFFEYKDNRGVGYFTRRELLLEKVPSGAFYNIKKVGTFHPAVVLEDTNIQKISKPYVPEKNFTKQVNVDVDQGGEVKQVIIGFHPGLPGRLGFDSDDLVAAGLSELAQRKINQMLREGQLGDHIFTGDEIPDKDLTGFEAYKALRDSIK